MNRTPLLQATAPQCMKTILASAGVAFVDISYSTEGAVLRTEKEFTQDLNPKQTALWGTTCSRLAPTSNIEWRASGGTTPTCIFRQYPEVPDDWGAFVLVTDGEVHETEVRRLSAVAHKTAHLPTILAIAVEFLPQTIARCNVSVLYSHFVAAQTAALIVVHGERLHVIKAKGEWEEKEELSQPGRAVGTKLDTRPCCHVAEDTRPCCPGPKTSSGHVAMLPRCNGRRRHFGSDRTWLV